GHPCRVPPPATGRPVRHRCRRTTRVPWSPHPQADRGSVIVVGFGLEVELPTELHPAGDVSPTPPLNELFGHGGVPHRVGQSVRAQQEHVPRVHRASPHLHVLEVARQGFGGGAVDAGPVIFTGYHIDPSTAQPIHRAVPDRDQEEVERFAFWGQVRQRHRERGGDLTGQSGFFRFEVTHP